MSYPKDYRNSVMYLHHPDVVDMMIDLEPGQEFTITFDFTGADDGVNSLDNYRYHLYGFQKAFWGYRRFSITKDGEDVLKIKLPKYRKGVIKIGNNDS